MRLDVVPPDPGLPRFWGSRDEVEAQARSRRRRPRPAFRAGTGEPRLGFPDCEALARPMLSSRVRARLSRSSRKARKGLRALECVGSQARSRA